MNGHDAKGGGHEGVGRGKAVKNHPGTHMPEEHDGQDGGGVMNEERGRSKGRATRIDCHRPTKASRGRSKRRARAGAALAFCERQRGASTPPVPRALRGSESEHAAPISRPRFEAFRSVSKRRERRSGARADVGGRRRLSSASSPASAQVVRVLALRETRHDASAPPHCLRNGSAPALRCSSVALNKQHVLPQRVSASRESAHAGTRSFRPAGPPVHPSGGVSQAAGHGGHGRGGEDDDRRGSGACQRVRGVSTRTQAETGRRRVAAGR
ncbi:S4 domain protein [Gracilaria domingensis]|nr:S4 domain protein [Gracilaria domingensis]